jgi:hypothetical protein
VRLGQQNGVSDMPAVRHAPKNAALPARAVN